MTLQEIKKELVKVKDPIILFAHIAIFMFVWFDGVIGEFEIRKTWMLGVLLISAYVSLTKDTSYPSTDEVQTNGGYHHVDTGKPVNSSRNSYSSSNSALQTQQELETKEGAEEPRTKPTKS